jgi:dTDP-4-dehydrorhamnose 3,5-epimerase
LFDVVADVRPGSPTYKKWFGVWLDEKNLKQLFIPAGCAHGFFSAEDDTILMYSQDGLWNSDFEYEIHWKDPSLAISWPEAENYILSEKDQKAKFLN